MRTSTPLSRLVALVALLAIMLTALPGSAMAQRGDSVNRGNSANAHACQGGGWETLYRIADGSGFANQGECVSYGAQSGTLIDANTRECFDNWQSLARSDEATVPFANQDECVSYGAQGGTLTSIPVVLPDFVLMNGRLSATGFSSYSYLIVNLSYDDPGNASNRAFFAYTDVSGAASINVYPCVVLTSGTLSIHAVDANGIEHEETFDLQIHCG